VLKTCRDMSQVTRNSVSKFQTEWLTVGQAMAHSQQKTHENVVLGAGFLGVLYCTVAQYSTPVQRRSRVGGAG